MRQPHRHLEEMLEEWRLFYDLPREDRIAYLNFPADPRLPLAEWLSAGKPTDPIRKRHFQTAMAGCPKTSQV